MMKIINILFSLLLPFTLFSQKGIGFNTLVPTESVDINTSVRLRGLPLNLSTNAISTFTDGTASPNQDQTFNAVNTVVADNNGVIGIASGVAITELPNYKTLRYKTKTTTINANVRTNSILIIEDLAIYLDWPIAGNADVAAIKFCLLNGLNDNVIANLFKQGIGGIFGFNTKVLNVIGYTGDFNNLSSTVNSSIWHDVDASYRLSLSRRDYVQFMFSLINNKQLYRMSAVVNAAIPANASQHIPASNATVTFFVEYLDVSE